MHATVTMRWLFERANAMRIYRFPLGVIRGGGAMLAAGSGMLLWCTAGMMPLEIAPQSQTIPAPSATAHKAGPAQRARVTAREKRYLSELSSGSYAQRRAAKKALIALGMPALPPVRHALKDAASPQMRGVLAAVINKIKLLALLQPTYITLYLRHATARKVIRRIAAQAHVPITLFSNMTQSNPEINFNEVHQPLWQVLIDLQKKTGFGLPRWRGAQHNGAIALLLVGRTPPPVSICGPFMAQAISFQRNSSLQLADDPAQQMPAAHFFNLQMRFAAEPRMPIVHAGALTISQAITKTGKSIWDGGVNATNVYFNPGSGWFGSGYVNFATVPNMGHTLRVLKGNFSCVIASRVARLKLTHLFHPSKNTHVVHGVTVVFAGLKHTGNRYTATLVLSNPAGASAVAPMANQPVYDGVHSPDILTRQASFLSNTVVLSGAKGQALSRMLPVTRISQTTAIITLTWMAAVVPNQVAMPGKPKEMDLSIPLAFHHVNVPFAFHNLPIP